MPYEPVLCDGHRTVSKVLSLHLKNSGIVGSVDLPEVRIVQKRLQDELALCGLELAEILWHNHNVGDSEKVCQIVDVREVLNFSGFASER